MVVSSILNYIISNRDCFIFCAKFIVSTCLYEILICALESLVSEALWWSVGGSKENNYMRDLCICVHRWSWIYAAGQEKV